MGLLQCTTETCLFGPSVFAFRVEEIIALSEKNFAFFFCAEKRLHNETNTKTKLKDVRTQEGF